MPTCCYVCLLQDNLTGSEEVIPRSNKRLGLQGIADFPVCYACKIELEKIRDRGLRLFALLIGITLFCLAAVFALQQYFGKERAYDLLTSIVIIAFPVFVTLLAWNYASNRRNQPVTFAQWGKLPENRRIEIGWSQGEDGLLVPTQYGEKYANVIPVFRNVQYQYLFDNANAIQKPFDLPFGPELKQAIYSSRPPLAKNLVCPKCRSVYNRLEVIRQIRKRSPELFDFANWTTKFACVHCREILLISGTKDEI